MAIKGYVVRFLDGETACEVTPDSLTSAVRAVRELPAYDASIFRVHDDGREERLPSYEEALAEIERLRVIEALNVGAIDASLVRLGAVTGAIGPMPRLDLATLCDERDSCEDARELFDLIGRIREVAVAQSSDPLAALEAAERRLLEAGGWIEAKDGWVCPVRNLVWMRDRAVTIERRRLAAKGGA